MTFTSCTKDVEDNLPGTWDMSINVFFFSSTGTATFDEDGTGTWKIDGESAEKFTWSATEETVTMVFTDGDDTEKTVFTVVENKKNSQEWTATETEDGLTVTLTVKLTK